MFITKRKHRAAIDALTHSYNKSLAASDDIAALDRKKLEREIQSLRADKIAADNEVKRLKGKLTAFAHKHKLPAPGEE